MGKKIKTIEDLSFDQSNINKGSEWGTALLERSLSEVGAGRSVLADKNGVLIAGNKTIEAAGALGLSKIKVVQTTGEEIVVVQRTDLDINSKAGAKMKILDNTVSKHNYIEDAEISEAVCEDYAIDGEQYGLSGAPEHEDTKIKKIAVEPYEKTHVLISFPPDRMLQLQNLIEQIGKIEGVEIEQSSN
jgi:hypothetical protein